jgi:hypothetical protein
MCAFPVVFFDSVDCAHEFGEACFSQVEEKVYQRVLAFF